MLKFNRNTLATIGGLITTVCLALNVIDWDTFDYKNAKNWMKIIMIAVPAIGGYVSEIKKNEPKP